jgi:hypothetical protein
MALMKASRDSKNQFVSWGTLQQAAEIPALSCFVFPRERAGVQQCVVLCSLLAEFQVSATPWRFLNQNVHMMGNLSWAVPYWPWV